MNSIYDLVEGIDNVKPSLVLVEVKHYYDGILIEDDHGHRRTLEYIKVDGSGEIGMYGRELTKQGKPKGSYASYISKVRYDAEQRSVPVPWKVVQ